MRLKSIIARDMREGMRRVREQLGDDAIIVSTEETENGVLITAATDRDELVTPAADTAPPAESPDEGRPDDRAEPVIERVEDCLEFHGVPANIARSLIAAASDIDATTPVEALAAALDGQIGFSTIDPISIQHPLMIVGDAGAGKTVIVAKLAAEAALAGRGVTVITTDTTRAGGTEQLAALMRAIGVRLLTVQKAANLAAALSAADSDNLALIDTAAVAPLADDARPLLAFLSNPVEPILAMPAGLQAGDMAETACVFARTLGVQRFIATRVDLSRRCGGVLAAAHAAGISLAGLSESRRLAESISETGAHAFTDLLFNRMASTGRAYRNAGKIQDHP